MIRILALFTWVLAASVATAQEAETPAVADTWAADTSHVFDATSLDIDTLVWLARPVVVFADSANDPRFREQMDLLLENIDELAERDVIILTDTDPTAQSPLRTRLRPRGFGLVIIGKDGEVELRKPSPWDVREITRSIDKMPLRQQEIDDLRFEQ
jgi:hypothetical protein